MQIFKSSLLAVAVCAATSVVGNAWAAGFASYFAVVTPNGATARGAGVDSSARTSAGNFEVVFTREVTACGFVASVNGANSGFAVAIGDSTNANRILVKTFGTNGAPANRTFTVIVTCAP